MVLDGVECSLTQKKYPSFVMVLMMHKLYDADTISIFPSGRQVSWLGAKATMVPRYLSCSVSCTSHHSYEVKAITRMSIPQLCCAFLI